MIERNYLFLSGESNLTMRCVFRREKWMHTCSASKLIIDDNKLHRSLYSREDLKGVIFYADMQDKIIEQQNLENIKKSKVPCWPNIDSMIKMLDRIDVLKLCHEARFVDHQIDILTSSERSRISLQYPFVLKIGNVHRGQDKFLIESRNTWNAFPEWQGLATIEPYFAGRSVRALIIGDKTFGIQIDNDDNWIKNQAGAEISCVTLSDKLIRQANECAQMFNLDCAGIDYIVEDDGTFHFLEINHFPGLSNISDEVDECVEKFLDAKMRQIECH